MMIDGLILRINTKHPRFNEGHLMETEEINRKGFLFPLLKV